MAQEKGQHLGVQWQLVDLDRNLDGQDAHIVHILHDEIIVEVREDTADGIAVTMRNCIERTFAEIFPEVPFVVDPEIGDDWVRAEGPNNSHFEPFLAVEYH